MAKTGIPSWAKPAAAIAARGVDRSTGQGPGGHGISGKSEMAGRVAAPVGRNSGNVRTQMATRKQVEFKSEAEEARWFEDNQDRLLELFEQAGKDGVLRIGDKSVGITLAAGSIASRGGVLRKPPSQKVMLRIPTGDVEKARHFAAEKGIGYQTYIKMLLRAGLEREEKTRLAG